MTDDSFFDLESKHRIIILYIAIYNNNNNQSAIIFKKNVICHRESSTKWLKLIGLPTYRPDGKDEVAVGVLQLILPKRPSPPRVDTA